MRAAVSEMAFLPEEWRPADAAPFVVNLNAFPRPGQQWGER